MNLSAPKKWTFVAAVILWLLGLIGMFAGYSNTYPMLGLGVAYWIGMMGGLLLILGCLLEGF